MNYELPDIKKADVKNKRVFLRADTDVPLDEIRNSKFEIRNIEDETRLQAWLPTLQYLLKQGASVIIGGKLGRPEGVDSRLSLQPVAQWISRKINDEGLMIKDKKIGEFSSWEVSPNVFVLENLQFYKEEKENNPEFVKKLAMLADIYVNDAFAVSHRNNASVVGIPSILPHYAGFRLVEEVKVLGHVLDNPKRPLVVVIGGAKIETKLPLVAKMSAFADYVLVGGKIAMEREVLDQAQKSTQQKKATVLIGDLNFSGTDLSEQSIARFCDIIKTAKTIVWNGPVGLVQSSKLKVKSAEDTEKGTRAIAKAIAESGAYTVIGGGDTIGFIHKMGMQDKFSFISTGGGAMLTFLSGEALHGLEALIK